MNSIARAVACALVALVTTLAPALAAGPAPDLSVTGTYPLGRCLDAQHQDMGPGKYVEAPRNFDPVTASDAELACYGFPPRPTDAENLHRWTVGMNLHHPVEWVHAAAIQGAIMVGTLAHPASTLNQRAPSTQGAAGGVSPDWLGGSGTTLWDNWGGWVDHPGAVNNYYPFYLIQGQWVQPSSVFNDGQWFSNWVGLGGDIYNDTLYQAGSIIFNPAANCTYPCSANYTFFYERVVWGTNCCAPDYVPQPQLIPGHTEASVVEEFTNGSTSYEECDETVGYCVWYGDQHSSNTSLTGEWIVEDPQAAAGNKVCPPGVTSNCFDGQYPVVHWGPNSTANNQNILDDPAHYNSWQLQQFPADAHLMGVLNTGPAFDSPGPVNVSNTAFNSCVGKVTNLSTWAPPLCY